MLWAAAALASAAGAASKPLVLTGNGRASRPKPSYTIAPGRNTPPSLQSQKAPDGEWRVVNSGSGLTLANAFSPAEVARCVLAWSAKNQSRVSLGVWSRKRTLAPGERMRLETAYELR